MAQTSVDIPQLKFNKMSTAKYNKLKEAGQLVENEFYITPDGGTIPEVNTDTNQQVLSNDGTNLIWRNEQVGYKQITNCITEIPQDIKLELNDGTLTLKAGSKVYVPNGTGKFNEVTISSDKTITHTSNGTYSVFVTENQAFLSITNIISSGEGFDIQDQQYHTRYNITDNIIRYTTNYGSSWDVNNLSFPLCHITVSNGKITSIDQVFNGFGYIGSTIFALPGVKGLIPNGRNADGSLKNIEFTIDSVKTATRTWTWDLTSNPPYQNIAYVKYNNTDINNTIWFFNHYIESKVKPAVYTYTFWYNPDTNIMYFNGKGSDYTQCQAIFLCNTWANGTTNVVEMWGSKKSPFHALDYNNSSTISGWSMPSDRYIDLTLGASGASYIAPANGWFWLSKKSSAANQYMNIGNNISGYVQNYSSGASDVMNLMRPARKGETVFIYYNVAGSTNYFKFIYAEGEL